MTIKRNYVMSPRNDLINGNSGNENMNPRDPGPIWGGWWFWEPPPGKTKENDK